MHIPIQKTDILNWRCRNAKLKYRILLGAQKRKVLQPKSWWLSYQLEDNGRVGKILVLSDMSHVLSLHPLVDHIRYNVYISLLTLILYYRVAFCTLCEMSIISLTVDYWEDRWPSG